MCIDNNTALVRIDMTQYKYKNSSSSRTWKRETATPFVWLSLLRMLPKLPVQAMVPQ